MNNEELQNKIKDLEDRIAKLETRRILQMDIMPQVVKSRHLDSVEMNLYVDSVNKTLGIGAKSSGARLDIRGTIDGTDAVPLVVEPPSNLYAALQFWPQSGGGNVQMFDIRGDGYMQWGSGSALDTNLYRYAASVLKTDGALIINGDTTLGNSFQYGDGKFMVATKGPLLIDRVTATVYRLKVTSGTLGVEAV